MAKDPAKEAAFDDARSALAAKAGVSLTPRSGFKAPAPQHKPIKFIWASEIEPKEVQFLWRPYIPMSAMTLLFGEGGIGKSWIISAIASALSTGAQLPGGGNATVPQKVMIISAEDDLEQVIVPRLQTLGANRDNILLASDSFILDNPHAEDIERQLQDISATVVFLDPLVAFTGGQMDLHRANEARSFTDRLRKIAQRLQKAVVVVHHTRKSKDTASDMERALGSVDFGNAIRSGLYVGTNKAGRKFIRHAKANWSEKGATLWFTTEGSNFKWEDPPGAGDDNSITVSTTRRQNASQWLSQFLSGGPVPAMQVYAAGRLAGFSERTLNRAKPGVVRSRRLDDQSWVWELESAPPQIDLPIAQPLPPATEPEPQASGTLGHTPPTGMSQEEWDNLVRQVTSAAGTRD